MQTELNVLWSDVIWSEKFWLPEKFTWKDVERVNHSDGYRPIFYYILVAAVSVHIIRNLVKRKISIPLATYFGLKEKLSSNIGDKNPALEKEFRSFGKQLLKDKYKLHGLVKKGFGTEREIERWLRRRIAQDNPSRYSRFLESNWKFLYYSFMSLYGFYALWDQPWAWDYNRIWDNFPLQTFPAKLKWYYIITAGYCVAEFFIQFTVPRKKDHWQLVVHHVVAVLLIMLTYMGNFTRFLAMSTVLHDLSDILLHLGKMIDYTQKKKMMLLCFIVFGTVWVVTRLISFPYLAYVFIIGTRSYPMPVSFIAVGIFCILQFLHIVWSYYIFKMFIQVLTEDKCRDIRSCSEEESD